MSITFVLLLLAFVFFILAALNVPRGNWVAIGLACWMLSILIGTCG